MNVLLWAFASITTVAFAYSMQFTQATLSFGRDLANTSDGTGF